MSQFVSGAPVPVGAVLPLQVGGTLSYSNQTKPSAFANAKVKATYGFKSYDTMPGALGERSGHYSKVVEQPDDKLMGQPVLDDIFTPSDPEMIELTKYYASKLPSEQRNLKATYTIKQYGLQDLLGKYLRKQLQEDAEMVKARYAGATQVEADIASAKLQNRYSDMIRHYGSDQRLRQALLDQYTGGNVEPALSSAIQNALQREMNEGGAGAFSVDPNASASAMSQMGGAVDSEVADATEGQESEMMETEQTGMGTEYQNDTGIAEELQRVRENIESIQESIDTFSEALEDVASASEAQSFQEQIADLEEKLAMEQAREAELRELVRERGIGDAQSLAADSGVDMGDSATAQFVDDSDLPASYAPGGASSSSAYTPVHTAGGGGGLHPEFSEPGAPTSSSSRPLVGEIIGQEAKGVPARSMATSDPGAAGRTARQESIRSRASRRQAHRDALHRAIMGMELTGIDEEQPVSVHEQSVGTHDARNLQTPGPARRIVIPQIQPQQDQFEDLVPAVSGIRIPRGRMGGRRRRQDTGGKNKR